MYRPRLPVGQFCGGLNFVEGFAGSGNLGKAVAQLDNWNVAQHDILNGIDMLAPNYASLMESGMRDGLVTALSLATECTTFSRANTKHPYRNRQYPKGLPTLGLTQRQKAEVGNQLLQLSLRLFWFALSVGTLVFLENPSHSRLWDDPNVQPLIMEANRTEADPNPRVVLIKLHYCMYGRRFQKPTTILAAFKPRSAAQYGSLKMLKQRLQTRCVHTRHRTILQFGATKRLGNPYPPKLCNRWAACIDDLCRCK